MQDPSIDFVLLLLSIKNNEIRVLQQHSINETNPQLWGRWDDLLYQKFCEKVAITVELWNLFKEEVPKSQQ